MYILRKEESGTASSNLCLIPRWSGNFSPQTVKETAIWIFTAICVVRYCNWSGLEDPSSMSIYIRGDSEGRECEQVLTRVEGLGWEITFWWIQKVHFRNKSSLLSKCDNREENDKQMSTESLTSSISTAQGRQTVQWQNGSAAMPGS